VCVQVPCVYLLYTASSVTERNSKFGCETTVMTQILRRRVSYESRFILKEPKLVLTLSKPKRLVSVVLRNKETASFGVSVEAKLPILDVKRLD
jgi:hypothetical protein